MTSVSSGARTNWSKVYWFGVLLTAACIVLVLVGQSEIFHTVEHKDFPLSWALAGLAILAFTVAEICQHMATRRATSGKRQ